MKTDKKLAHLKVGDKVILHPTYGGWSVRTITRETATRWYMQVNEHGEVWVHKENGWGPRPAGFGVGSYIELWTPKRQCDLQMNNFKRMVGSSMNYRVAHLISDKAWHAFYAAYLEAVKKDTNRQRRSM